MLQQFTWMQFLLTSLILSFIWYGAVLFTAYRSAFFSFLKGRHPLVQKSVLKQKEQKTIAPESKAQLIGPSRMPEGMEKVSTTAIRFGAGEGQPDDQGGLHDDQLGLVPDVIQEIKEIFEVLAKEDGNKSDFFRLAKMLSEKYGRIASNPNIGRINEFIREHAPFAIRPDELENLWD